MRTLRLLAALLLFAANCAAQYEPIDRYLERLTAVQSEDMDDWQAAYEELMQLVAAPQDLNRMRREDFERLPFLSAPQIEEICYYRHTHERFDTMAELLALRTMDRTTAELLECFITISPDTLLAEPQSARQWLRQALQGHHTIAAAGNMPLYKRKGDRNGYLGYGWRHWLRYRYNADGSLTAGLTAAQDAGEPFATAGNGMGYDYYSIYALARGIGPVSTLALGRYRLSAGMGLVLGSGIMLGKGMALANLGRAGETIRAHSGKTEAGYFQGAAATVAIGKEIEATAFFSRRALDGSLNDDGSVATISYSDYHRTPAEMLRKHNTHATAYGGRLAWASERYGLTLGATAIATRLDRRLDPNTKQFYRRYYPAGTDFANFGIDAAIARRDFTMQGEVASDKHGNIAAIAAAAFMPTSGLELTILGRTYSYKYAALHARSYSDGGRVQNEQGIAVAAKWRPVRPLTINFYTDFSRFRWPRYLCDRSSTSSDNMLSARLRRGQWNIESSYRLRLRHRNNADKTGLIGRTEHRARFAATRRMPAQGLEATSQIDLALTDYNATSRGIMLGQHLQWERRTLRLHLCASWFATDDYDSRVYTTAHGSIYGLGTVAASGRGIRLSLSARWRPMPAIALDARIGHTRYFDRDAIGTGLQQIDSNNTTDIEMQASIRL